MIPAYYLANKLGIPRIESTGVNVTTDKVQYTFRSHTMLLAPFVGILIVRLGQPTPPNTDGTLPVVFNSGDTDTAVTKLGGEPLKAADLPGTGVYLFFYDAYGKVLQLIQ